MEDDRPGTFIFMLKMVGCYHCDITIENIKTVLGKKKNGNGMRFFIATREQYEHIEKFVDGVGDDAIRAVTAFPSFFVIQNGKIIHTPSAGQKSVEQLVTLSSKFSKKQKKGK